MKIDRYIHTNIYIVKKARIQILVMSEFQVTAIKNAGVEADVTL